MKEYLYIAGDKIKIWSNNLAVKLEAVRQNQDEIIKVKDSINDIVTESAEVTKSIEKTAANLENYDAGKIRDIDDISGIEDLVKDIKETKEVTTKSIEKFEKHIKSIEDTGELTEDAVKQLTQSEKAILELYEMEKNLDKAKADAEKHIQEDKLEEKEQSSNSSPNSKPDEPTEECPLKKCNLDLVTITDNSGRKIEYDTNASDDEEENTTETSDGKDKKKKTPPKPTTLYVICGEKEGFTEEITISTKGNCTKGGVCPSVSMQGDGIDEKDVKTISNIQLKSEKMIPDKSWADFIRKLVVPDMKQIAKPEKYTVNVHDCDKQDDINELKIIAFPPAGWNGNAKIKYVEKEKSDKDKIKNKNKEVGFDNVQPMGEWDIGGELNCYLDKEKWKFSPPDKFLEPVQECLNKIVPLFNEIDNDYASIKIGWPNLEFGGNVDLAEVPDHHQLSYDGNINLKADPFLSVDIDVDIKAIILRIIGKHKVFSDFMMDILKRLEEGVGDEELGLSAKIEVKLLTNAEISGDLHWERKSAEGKWSVNTEECKIGGSMGIELYGAAHVEGNAFFVKACAGASFAIRSKDGKDMSRFSMFWAAIEGIENPSLERQMEFNGLAIYYSKYAQLGIDDTEAGIQAKLLIELAKQSANDSTQEVRTDDEEDEEDAEESDNLVNLGSEDMEELCVLMDTWKSTDEKTELGKDPI